MSSGAGNHVSYRAAARLAATVASGLLAALVAYYLRAEERHEERQDSQLARHEQRLHHADAERAKMQIHMEAVARGVQWLVNRRTEEVGVENLSEPPPVVDADSARSGG